MAKILIVVPDEMRAQIKADATANGQTVTEWLLTGRGYKPQPKYKFPKGGLNPRGRKMPHHSSIQFQKKISEGVEILRESTNGLTGDQALSAVEFSDGSVGVFGNGDPEWVGTWAEALQLLNVEGL